MKGCFVSSYSLLFSKSWTSIISTSLSPFYWEACSISGRFSFELEVVKFSMGLFSAVNSFFIVSFISCKFDWTCFTYAAALKLFSCSIGCCYSCTGTPRSLANVAALRASMRSSSYFSFCSYSLRCYSLSYCSRSKLLSGDLSISARVDYCYEWILFPIPEDKGYVAFLSVSGEFDFRFLVPWRGDGTGEICCGCNYCVGRATGGLWVGGIYYC